ncbi:hypothetical protein [Nodosilinea sp. FACHB-13]|uniref:hypothetical protein n=1 Tax=Cyanophyceae TaxID=3028117 RepID=UPI00168515A8|nr:hypothetical protein [Nodosilinea sp. FACHB-13]MBD2105620.1 hypothetical protein [Nodosilinea sp. FACHB-13]
MLYGAIAAEITEALAGVMLDTAKKEVTGALAKEAQKRMRLQDKTYEEWKDLIFTIAFTGNFPKDDRVTVLANQVNAAHQRIDALEKQLKSLSISLEKKTDYLRSEIFAKAEQSLYSSIAHEDNVFKQTLSKIKKSFIASGNNPEHEQAEDMANHFAELILEEEANYQESITRIYTTLMPSKDFDNANLFDAWKSAAIFHSESSTLGQTDKRLEIYKEMERGFASILMLQLRYMQVLLDSYRVHQTSPLPVKTNESPQQFLNDFYENTFEPEISGFVKTVEQWLINIFPYPQSPATRVDIPEDIRQILVQLNYFAEKTLKPIKEYVTYHHQSGEVMTIAQSEALQGRIFIPGDRWRNYQDGSKLMVRLVDSSSGGQQFDAIGLLEFQSIKFLSREQNGALRGPGLLVGGRWKQYPELLMAKFVPHRTPTDLVPAGPITLDIRDFDTNRVLQRVTALFTAAEGTSQPVICRSFTTFMSTGVEVVDWSRSPVMV